MEEDAEIFTSAIRLEEVDGRRVLELQAYAPMTKASTSTSAAIVDAQSGPGVCEYLYGRGRNWRGPFGLEGPLEVVGAVTRSALGHTGYFFSLIDSWRDPGQARKYLELGSMPQYKGKFRLKTGGVVWVGKMLGNDLLQIYLENPAYMEQLGEFRPFPEVSGQP